ncbi:MAG: hypothetical protein HFI39_06630 [Lachnospiraceae bacterium]|nr:hypothetical protein [Lachnospiraceae bacterium]
MRKMDEMDRDIQLRSEEWGYRSVMLSLAAWTFFNCWQTLRNGADYHPLPGLIFCFASCVQGFSQLAVKRKMVAGEEEYKAPNKLLWIVLAVVTAAVIIVSMGTFFIVKA